MVEIAVWDWDLKWSPPHILQSTVGSKLAWPFSTFFTKSESDWTDSDNSQHLNNSQPFQCLIVRWWTVLQGWDLNLKWITLIATEINMILRVMSLLKFTSILLCSISCWHYFRSLITLSCGQWAIHTPADKGNILLNKRMKTEQRTWWLDAASFFSSLTSTILLPTMPTHHNSTVSVFRDKMILPQMTKEKSCLVLRLMFLRDSP